ncbi:activator of Hsp90 ATPase [Pavlovales sp. CCMP2436]|nr:activator of Hsp90 ATPase [Pavlovales sp. CCMP2436]
MAEFGKGDARWIVKERADGHNVNSWHWEAKDQTEWAKKRLSELLADIVVLDDATGSCKLVKVDSISGEVSLQSRKNRRFALYELDITVKWEGQLFDAEGKTDVETKGTLRIEDLSEETLDGLPTELTCDSTAGRRQELKELMRTKGADLVKKACLDFVKELKAAVANGLGGPPSDPFLFTFPFSFPPPAARTNATYVTSSADSTADTAKLEVDYSFPLNPHFVYESLIDTNRMRAATAADALIEPRVGGVIKLFNGSVEGEIVELVPGEKIVQKWRFNTWQPGHFSNVVITLSADGGNTKLKLVQTGVPVEERERTEKGWRVMIFDRLKMVLGGVPP